MAFQPSPAALRDGLQYPPVRHPGWLRGPAPTEAAEKPPPIKPGVERHGSPGPDDVH